MTPLRMALQAGEKSNGAGSSHEADTTVPQACKTVPETSPSLLSMLKVHQQSVLQ
jgi:hypothetical protein